MAQVRQKLQVPSQKNLRNVQWILKSYATFNRARMMLLSKEKHTNAPPIGRIRPIQMYTPLRKAFESTIDYLDSELIWASIWNHQAGPRPKQKLWKQTSEVIELLKTETYNVAWFVYFSKAFNKVHQLLLVDVKEDTKRFV
jgi:hypothetical protein